MRTIRRDPPQFMWVLIIYKRLFSIIIEFHLLSFTNTTDGFSLALWDPGSCMGPISFMGPTSCWHQDASSGWQGNEEVGVAKQAMFFHAFPYPAFAFLQPCQERDPELQTLPSSCDPSFLPPSINTY